MAGRNHNWVKPLAVAALLVFAGILVRAQSIPTGSLIGKLTDLHSSPLSGATVVLRSHSTGAVERTTTAKDGVYRFSALEAGKHILEADSPQLGHGQLADIQVSAGHEAHVQTAVQFDLAPPAPVHSVFLDNPRLIAPLPPTPISSSSATLPAALPTETPRLLQVSAHPIPGLPLEPPPTQAPFLTAALQPVPQPAFLVTALPAFDVPKAIVIHPATLTTLPAPVVTAQSSIVHTAPGIPRLAATESIVNGLRVAAQWSLPRQNHIQAASQQNDPASPAVTTTLTASELQSLPATGRHWEEFALDTPATTDGSSEAALHGGNQQPANTIVDGTSTQLAFDGGSSSSRGADTQSTSSQSMSEPAGMGQPSSAGRGFFVSEAAIRQVQTSTGNVEARGAQGAGGYLDVETQRGSNSLHGQAFLFDRQNTWGARNPSSQWVKETAPATSTLVPVFTAQPFTPPDHEITWGIGAGSHILRNKLFWFAALDNNRRNDPALSTVKWPTNFFAQPANDQMQLLGAQLGTSTSSALAKYSQMLETLDGLLGPAPRVSAQWVGFARIDWSRRAPPLYAGRKRGQLELARGRPLACFRDLRKPQPGIEPGQPPVADGPLAGLRYP